MPRTMPRRTSIPWLASVGLVTVVVALFGAAAPAQAAPTIAVGCSAGAWAGPFTVAPGETLTLDGSACGQPANLSATDGGLTVGSLTTSLGGSAIVPGWGTGSSVQYTAPAITGTDSFYVNLDNANYWPVRIIVTNVTAQTPPPWLQQYGRLAASDSCAPGWDPSWAEWVFERAGGYVCQRAIYWRGNGWYVSPSAVWGLPSEVGTPWVGR